MSKLPKQCEPAAESSFDPCRTVDEYLRSRFTGGGLMQQPAECASFNTGRYAWLKKRIENAEEMEGSSPAEAVVCSLGTLYGAWPDGTPFEGNRYVLRAGLATLDAAPADA